MFITSRLKEINSLEGAIFRYIPSQENPADMAKRGKSPSDLHSSIWWNAPPWLSKPEFLWPPYRLHKYDHDNGEITEVKGPKVLFEAKLVAAEDPTETVPTESSRSLQKLLRVTAWIIQYANKFMKREQVKASPTLKDLEEAKLLRDVYVQEKCYVDIIKRIKNSERYNLKDQFNLMIDEEDARVEIRMLN